MNKIPTPQQAAEIDGKIVNFDTFWGSIQEGVKWLYSNNFFACFREDSSILDFKSFLDQNPDNFDIEIIYQYVIGKAGPREKWNNWSITEESLQKRTTELAAFAEYYRAFPEKLEKLIEMTQSFDNISKEIANYACGRVHELTDEYMNGLYHAYAYMRTQPGTSDAILTA